MTEDKTLNLDKMLRELENKMIFQPATIKDGQYRNVTQINSNRTGARKGQSNFPKQQDVAHRTETGYTHEHGTKQGTSIINNHTVNEKIKTIHGYANIEQDAVAVKFGRAVPAIRGSKADRDFYKAALRAKKKHDQMKSGHVKAADMPQQNADHDKSYT